MPASSDTPRENAPASPGSARTLEEQRHFFLTLLSNAFDGVAILDSSGQVAWVVPGTERFLGYTPEELLGQGAFNLVHPEDLGQALETLGRTLATSRGAIVTEARFRHKTGEWRRLRVRAVNRLDDPVVRGIVISHHDVTERDQAQRALAGRERHLRALLENAFEVVVIVDSDAVLRYVAPSMTRVLGWTITELENSSVLELVHPDDQETALDTLAVILESPGKAMVVPLLRLRHKNGEWRTVRARAVNLLDDPAVEGIVGHFEDATASLLAESALRDSEARLAHVTSSVPGIVYQYRLGADGAESFPFVSSGSLDLVGVPAPELQENPRLAWDLVVPEDAPALQESIFASWRDATPWSHEWRIRTRDGHLRWLNGRSMPTREPDGATSWAGIFVDVTERKRLEDQLSHAQKMQSLGRLAGGVAHDFNNLLTGILGHTELALKSLGEGAIATRHLTTVREAARRGAALTRQLLAIARRQIVAPRILDVNEQLAHLDGFLRRLIGEEIELLTSLDPGLGRVRMDPGQIEQVLLNLVVNARDAMPRGGTLKIGTRNVVVAARGAEEDVLPPPGRWVELSVADSGVGMPEEVRQHAFEPFFTTKNPGEGTGLGLSTCYGIVQQSGGHITIESEPGRGTVIHIFLPREDAALDAPAESPPATNELGGSETILLAEDEPLVRAVVLTLLRAAGYTVLEASDGARALEIARAHPGAIDLLVTDVRMPRLGGFELARQLGHERPGTPVLFVSGHAESTLSHGEELGPTGAFTGDFLAKPFTGSELSGRVREILDRHRMEVSA